MIAVSCAARDVERDPAQRVDRGVAFAVAARDLGRRDDGAVLGTGVGPRLYVLGNTHDL